MNFSDSTKAWIVLICLVIGSGGTVGLTAFLGGAKWPIAVITGVITAATNVGHALAQSPKDKMSSGHTEMLYKTPMPPKDTP